ncbi:MAG: VapC toxin family PIN domain ribonuclease, partial [Jatrophihabitans sp.]
MARDGGTVVTTAITAAEVDHGIARLPEGHRKDRLAATAASVFVDFDEVMVAFDANTHAHVRD